MSALGTIPKHPRYGFLDVVVLLVRQWLLLALVFALICLIGFAAVVSLKKSYTAEASLFVGVGLEYLPPLRVGAGGWVMSPTASEVAQSEAAILNSLEVKKRVVRAMGIESFVASSSGHATPEQEARAVASIDNALSISSGPQSPVIGLSYKSDDPRRSAQILNTVIDQYLTYRREVFRDRATPAIRSKRVAFEKELETADRAYEEFLTSHQIGDFATARATLSSSYQTVFTERLSVRAQLKQASQRLRTLVDQQANVRSEIPLEQDLNISAQDLEAQIRRPQSPVATGTAVGAADIKIGLNPVWVELETRRIATMAECDSLAARLVVLDRQLGELNTRQARMNDLESRNANLAGNREMLSQSVRALQLREVQSRWDEERVSAGGDTVTVIERAQPPATGASLKIPLMVLVVLMAGFAALCVGLLRIFKGRGVLTPSSAARTFGIPVLAVARAK